jgi:hypothetical protein
MQSRGEINMVNHWKKIPNKIYSPFYRNYGRILKTEIGVGEGYGVGWEVDIFNNRFDDGSKLKNFDSKELAVRWMKNWMKEHPKG